MNSTEQAVTANSVASDEGKFSLKQRMIIWLASWVGTLAIRLIGPTLRYKVSIEEGGPATDRYHPAILVFWHCCVFPATYWFRNRGIAVMTSRSFDGEYIARIIERCGFPAVRGSSSRGAVKALLGMHTIIEQDHTVAFTIDGPRGPRFVAKPGPVLLARNTQVPIIAFHIALESTWVMRSWDGFMIPKPFSRAHLHLSKLIRVPADMKSAEMGQFHAEMQAALDRVREFAEENVSRNA